MMPSLAEWHTPPDKWKTPRIFHSPFEGEHEKFIKISKDKNGPQNINKNDKTFSPNNAYWFVSKKNRQDRYNLYRLMGL